MIKSAYFPDVAKCFAEIPRGDNKIEIPADVYDATAKAGTLTNNFFLRGAYDYETVKIFAQSGCIDALKFDDKTGEVKTLSTAGISAELVFAFAVWNGYSRAAAIERAILSQLRKGTDFLPEIFADKVSRIKINDASNIGKDFAKTSVMKSISSIENKLQASRNLSTEASVNVSKVPQIFQKVGDFFSHIGDEVIIVMRHGEDVKDFRNGRISGKQFLKNTAITLAGVAGGAALLFVFPVSGPLALLVGFVGKISYKENMKEILDHFVDDDSKKMLAIFDSELAKFLDGKFFTQYELQIFMELIADELNKNKLKDMFAIGDDTARAAWAQNFLSERSGKIFAQRILVESPSPEEWHAGFQRVMKALDDGEDIVENMKRRRDEALAKRREFFQRFGLKLYETAEIVQTVNAMNKTQLAAERTLKQLQSDNRRYETESQKLMNQRTALKDMLKRRR